MHDLTKSVSKCARDFESFKEMSGSNNVIAHKIIIFSLSICCFLLTKQSFHSYNIRAAIKKFRNSFIKKNASNANYDVINNKDVITATTSQQ